MAKYPVRVELHDAENEDYELLHGFMEDAGFARYITDRRTGTKYALPEAEYNIETGDKKSVVLRRAERAASLTGCSYGILVTESAGRIWSDLAPWEE